MSFTWRQTWKNNVAFRRTQNITGNLSRFFDLKPSDFLPTGEQVLRAMEHQKTRILRRTERGVDFEERPFAPYSRKGPYYFYPNGRPGSHRTPGEVKRAQAGVKRFATKIGRRQSAITRSGLGIRFDSYAEFKLTYLGRSNVDLTGPRAPHMLQQLVTFGSPSEGRIGIYGEARSRAIGHNEGTRNLARRRFLDSSAKDNTMVAREIRDGVVRHLEDEFGLVDITKPLA